MGAVFLISSRSRLLPFFSRFVLPVLCSFQLSARNNAPNSGAPEKCIFYWGKMQCALLATDNYRSTIEVAATAFRESVFSNPYLWNGKTVQDTVVFRLEDQMVESYKQEKHRYQDFQAILDQKFAQTAQPGAVFQINDLLLGNTLKGSIRIVITANKPAEFNMRRFPGVDQPVLVTKDWLDYFKWGPFIDEWMQRDYFTVEEVLATVRAEPVYTWNVYKVPEGMEVQMGPLMTDMNIPMQVADLTGMSYDKFADQFLQSYGHLIKPGMTMEFALRTARQRHTEMRALMQVVADDDPRLKLLRSRDGHQFELKWAGRTTNWDHLYLQSLKTPAGTMVNADPDTRLNIGYIRPFIATPVFDLKTVTQQNYDQFVHSRPVIKVDEIDIGNFSFDIEVNNNTWTVGPDENIPADLKSLLEEKINKGERSVFLVLKNIRGSDFYNFTPLSFDYFLPLPVL